MKKAILSPDQLKQALLAQPICQGAPNIAKWFIKHGVAAEKIPAGKLLLEEGDAKNKDLLLIVSGKMSIVIGDAFVVHREKNVHVGEMAMIMNEGRTASVVAAEESVVIRVPEAVMRQACDKFPVIWKTMAQTLCERLHYRRTFYRAANKIPKIFIGSSGASRGVAQELANQLNTALAGKGVARAWTDKDIFVPSSIIIDKLIAEAKEADFGIFVLAADDKLSHRSAAKSIVKTDKVIPRDNVIFEGGMFTAACGLERTFFVCEKHSSLHIPTDLSGVTNLPFSRKGRAKVVDFGTTVTELVVSIAKLGVITGIAPRHK